MEEITSMSEIIGLATDKVNLGRQLMNNLKDLLKSGVSGVSKIHKQISREVNNLLIVSANYKSWTGMSSLLPKPQHDTIFRPSTKEAYPLNRSTHRNFRTWSVS